MFLVRSIGKDPEESTAAMMGGSELCEPHPTPMLSLLLSCLVELIIAKRQQYEEPVLSPSEADTPASLPSHLPGTTTHPQLASLNRRRVSFKLGTAAPPFLGFLLSLNVSHYIDGKRQER